jgi:hypothetical protein
MLSGNGCSPMSPEFSDRSEHATSVMIRMKADARFPIKERSAAASREGKSQTSRMTPVMSAG